MKVIYVTQSVVEYDGQHYYSNPIQATYKRYLPLGDEIIVICHVKSVRIPQSDMIDDEKVRFVFIDKINSVKTLLFKARRIYKQIEREIKSSDVCVIHLPNEHGYKSVEYAQKYHKPFMTVVGGCPWDALWNYDLRGKIMAFPSFLRMRKVQRDSFYSIYVTQKFLQHRYPTYGMSIGCSNVNISTGDAVVLQQRIEKIKKVATPLRIGTAAAVDVPYKGQFYVIKAISKLRKKGIEFEYHLAGKGDTTGLEQYAKKCGVGDLVVFHGTIPHEGMLNFFDNIDVYIQPSKQEGLPRALIEAMSRGCLCAGSRTAGIPELLSDEYVFDKGDVNGICKILSRIKLDELITQAYRNFDEAKKYDKNVLDERRREFISTFKSSFCNKW